MLTFLCLNVIGNQLLLEADETGQGSSKTKDIKKVPKKKIAESSNPPEDEESDAEVKFDLLGSFIRTSN